MTSGSVSPMIARVSCTSLGVANMSWFKPTRSTSSFSASSTTSSSKCKLPAVKVVLIDTGAAMPRVANTLRSKRMLSADFWNAPFCPRTTSWKLRRTVDGNADVLQEPGLGEIRERHRAVFLDHGAVGGDVVAPHPLALEKREDIDEVLPYEGLAAGNVVRFHPTGGKKCGRALRASAPSSASRPGSRCRRRSRSCNGGCTEASARRRRSEVEDRPHRRRGP